MNYLIIKVEAILSAIKGAFVKKNKIIRLFSNDNIFKIWNLRTSSQ